MQNNKSNQTHAKARGRRRRIFTGGVAVVGSAGLAAAVLLPSGTALAAYQADSPPGTGTATTATVDVGTAIVLSLVTPTFTLTGVPGGLPTTDTAPVNYDVFTNNTTGYSVTVTPAAADAGTLHGTGGNLATIPVGDISAEDATAAGTPVTASPGVAAGALTALTTTPVTVHTQTVASAAIPGDVLHTTFAFTTPIPSVPNDTYTTTLQYIATEPPGAP